MRLLLAVLFFSVLAGCTSTDKATSRAIWGGYPSLSAGAPAHLQLPSIPSGCIVCVYHIHPEEFRNAPRNQTDWGAFLRAQGMIFPRGGFAAYFPETSTLVIANTPVQLALLDPI